MIVDYIVKKLTIMKKLTIIFASVFFLVSGFSAFSQNNGKEKKEKFKERKEMAKEAKKENKELEKE